MHCRPVCALDRRGPMPCADRECRDSERGGGSARRRRAASTVVSHTRPVYYHVRKHSRKFTNTGCIVYRPRSDPMISNELREILDDCGRRARRGRGGAGRAESVLYIQALYGSTRPLSARPSGGAGMTSTFMK